MAGKVRKRIILSDEDEMMDSAPNLTPSSKLAATLSGLNVTSTRKVQTKTTTKTVIADDDDSLASDNELDPEVTRKVMEGGVSETESEDDRYFHITNQNSTKKVNESSSRRSSRSSSVNAKQKLKDYYQDNDERFGETVGEHHDSDVIVLLSDSDSEGSLIQSRRGSRGGKTPASSSSRDRVTNTTSPPSSSSRTTPNTSLSAIKNSRTSERCKSVSSRQNAKRDAALEDLRRKSQSGLSGVLQSSSEEEGEGEKGDFDSSDEVQFVGTSSSSAPRKAPRQSSASAASLTSWARSQAAARSAVLRKDEREEEDGAGYDSVEDFIVGSDEEREEEELRQEEARQRKEERRKQRVASQPSSSSSSSSAQQQQRGDTPYRPSGGDCRGRKRVAEEDTEVRSGRKSRRIVTGEEEEEEEVQIVSGGSNRKRNGRAGRRSHLQVDEEEEEEQEEDGDADDESEEDNDEEEEEEVDEHLMYLRMNAMRDEYDEDDMLGAVLPMRRSFPRPEALRLYIEMLALSLVDPSFVQQMALVAQSGGGGGRGNPQLGDFVSASRQVENLICTNRESLLGSSAWRPEFLNQLCSRPFYSVNHLGAHSCGEKCEACGRTSQRPDFQVYLFGTTYDARKVWTTGRWDSLLPELMFLHNDCISSAADEHNAALARDPFNVHNSGRKNNKQFAQFSRLQEGEGKSRGVKSGSVAAALSLSHSLGEDLASSILSAQQRKRRVIELSDDEDEEREGEAKGGKNQTEMDNGAKQKRQRREEKEEEEVVDLEGEEREQNRANKWWLQKWPRSLTREAESKWQLAQHCKNRTQLYHTLLHYKFRLLLKIRDRLESDRNKHRGVDLSSLARDLAADQRFVGVEVARFENLLRHAGKKWGGKEEVAHNNDIWSDDEKGSTRQLQMHSKGSTTKRTTASLDGWLGTTKY